MTPRVKKSERFISIAVRSLLSGIFLVAGILKFANFDSVMNSLENYRLLPSPAVAMLSWCLPPAELAVGLALLPTATRGVAGLAAYLLSATFLAANASALWRGLDISCGCFSVSDSRIGWGNLALNLVMAVAASSVYTRAAKVRRPWLVLTVASLSVLVVTLMLLRQPEAQPPLALPVSGTPAPGFDLPVEDALNSPVLTFTPNDVLLGPLTKGEQVTQRVDITNVSSHSIDIEAVGLSCGCTKVDVSGSHLQAGETSHLTIRYEAGTRLGTYGYPVSLKLRGIDRPAVYHFSVEIVEKPYKSQPTVDGGVK